MATSGLFGALMNVCQASSVAIQPEEHNTSLPVWMCVRGGHGGGWMGCGGEGGGGAILWDMSCF